MTAESCASYSRRPVSMWRLDTFVVVTVFALGGTSVARAIEVFIFGVMP